MTRAILPRRPYALAAGLLLTTALLAGCAAPDATTGGADTGADAGNDTPEVTTRYASTAAALALPGSVHEPLDGGGLRLKVLHPADLTQAAQGETEFVLLIYDAETEAGVTGATVTLEAEMPSMGHGTTGEEDPVHDGFGVYVGKTNFIMNGGWLMNVDVDLPDGTFHEFDVDVHVGAADADSDTGGGGSDDVDHGDDHDMDHDKGHDDGHDDHGRLYASFDEAMAANGTTHAPLDPNLTVRLRLLVPDDPHHVHTDEPDVVFLFYDNDTGAPVTDADFTLRAFMPEMGHGTTGEEDPVHDAHGVYGGKTNFFMGGNWTLYVNGTLHDGRVAAFEVPVHVRDAHGGDTESDPLTEHGALFNSGDVGPGGNFTWIADANLAGKTVPYHCHYHALPGGGGMVGNVTVSDDAPVNGTVTVGMSDMAFWPMNLHVQPGTRIVWENNNTLAHTVTSGIVTAGHHH